MNENKNGEERWSEAVVWSDVHLIWLLMLQPSFFFPSGVLYRSIRRKACIKGKRVNWVDITTVITFLHSQYAILYCSSSPGNIMLVIASQSRRKEVIRWEAQITLITLCRPVNPSPYSSPNPTPTPYCWGFRYSSWSWASFCASSNTSWHLSNQSLSKTQSIKIVK